MPRDTLDRQMHHLQDEILLLAGMVEQAVLNAVDSLEQRNEHAAIQIYEDDFFINEKRFAIENAILITIATQQPIARDLRMLAAMLEVITELERMGDYAKGIAKVTVRLGDAQISVPMSDIKRMTQLGIGMLQSALRAFIEENPRKASLIPLEDDQVDELYNIIYRKLVDQMIANPEIIDQASLLMWVAHNLERLADRVTNICERTVFIATGELLELETTDDEDLKD